MHYSRTSLVTLILATALAVGCSTSISNPASPSNSVLTAGQVNGTWTLSSMQPAGQIEQAAPPGASYEVAFTDGRISTKADCNICGGGLVIGADTMTIGPALACTRAACPTMAFENTYVGILAGDSSARIVDNSLTLSSPRGVLRFRHDACLVLAFHGNLKRRRRNTNVAAPVHHGCGANHPLSWWLVGWWCGS